MEVVYVTIGNLAFCLAVYLTSIHFWGKFQHFGMSRVSKEKNKCRPIRTKEIGGVRLSEELYVGKIEDANKTDLVTMKIYSS